MFDIIRLFYEFISENKDKKKQENKTFQDYQIQILKREIILDRTVLSDCLSFFSINLVLYKTADKLGYIRGLQYKDEFIIQNDINHSLKDYDDTGLLLIFGKNFTDEKLLEF